MLSIGFAGPAFAGVQEFGPDTARFTIDVPAGWEAAASPTGVDLADGEKGTFLSISVGSARGRTPEQIANTLALANRFGKKGGFSNVVKKGPGLFAMHGETDAGLRQTLVLFVEDERYATCIMSGKDMDAVAKILDTLREKQPDAPLPAKAQESAMPLSATPAEKAPAESMGAPADAGAQTETDSTGEPASH